MKVSQVAILSNSVINNFRVFLFVAAVLFSSIITFAVRSVAGVTDSTIFAFTLDGSQTNSCAGNGSDRSGFAVCVLNSDSSQLSIHIEHDIDIADLIGGHVHFAPECVSGSVVFPLGALDSPIDINWAIDATNLQRLIDGELYINFHTLANATEEIRGQVVQRPIKFSFTLDESQLNTTNFPRTFSHSNGVALCELNASADAFRIRLCHDVEPPFFTGLHVHSGAVGETGDVLFFELAPFSPVDITWAPQKSDLILLFTEGLYLNLHSDVHVDGEVRGQIVQEELRFVFGIDGGQAKAGAGSGSDSKGFAILTLSGDGKSVAVYVEHDLAAGVATDGHINFGTSGNVGPALHSFAGSDSPIVETWSITDAEFEQLVAGQIYVEIETLANPTGEIRGQAPGVTDTSQAGEYPSCDVVIDADQANLCTGSGSSNTASGFIELKKGGRQLNIAIAHDIPDDSALAGHIHTGPECTEGPVAFAFTQMTDPIKEIWYVTDQDIIDLMRGELYVNLHTPLLFAGVGELRGQVLKNQGCCNTAGDADNNGSYNIADVTFGIARIFAGGPAPFCQDEADANGDNSYNIADVTYGIARIFASGLAPVCGNAGI